MKRRGKGRRFWFASPAFSFFSLFFVFFLFGSCLARRLSRGSLFVRRLLFRRSFPFRDGGLRRGAFRQDLVALRVEPVELGLLGRDAIGRARLVGGARERGGLFGELTDIVAQDRDAVLDLEKRQGAAVGHGCSLRGAAVGVTSYEGRARAAILAFPSFIASLILPFEP